MIVAARHRSIVVAVLIVAPSGGCSRSDSPESDSEVRLASHAVASPGEVDRAITARPPDSFYDPPEDLPARPGVLLRVQVLDDVTLPSGMQGWRILYTTTIDDTTRATAAAMVFAPTDLPEGPRPVITWEHGTTGLMQKCMPSLLSAPTEGIPARDLIVAAGWVVIATDYAFAEKGGPHPYIIGEGEARAALDAVRAAWLIPTLTLDTRTVVWGHSQGGHAALWTGIVGPRYAPDVEILGVAAIAPAANITNILTLNPAADKLLGPYLARSYSRFYSDVTFEQSVRPEALGAAREMANLCAVFPPEDPQRIAALSTSFDGPTLATSTNKALAARLTQNNPARSIAAPVLIAQGFTDNVVPLAATDAYVDERCAAGQRLEYWRFARHDHATIVQPGTRLEEPLIAWTAARFARTPQPNGCSRKSY